MQPRSKVQVRRGNVFTEVMSRDHDKGSNTMNKKSYTEARIDNNNKAKANTITTDGKPEEIVSDKDRNLQPITKNNKTINNDDCTPPQRIFRN